MSTTRGDVAREALFETIEHVLAENEATLVNCDSDPLTVEDFLSDLAWRLRRRLNDPEAS